MSFEDNKYTDEVLQDIKDLANFTDHEVGILKEVIQKIEEPLPSTLSGSQNKVSTIDALKPKLINLQYNVGRALIKAKGIYDSQYSTMYTKLVKMGRPTTKSIECEILAKPDMLEAKEQIEALEQVQNLLYSYGKALDNSRYANLKKWDDNKKI